MRRKFKKAGEKVDDFELWWDELINLPAAHGRIERNSPDFYYSAYLCGDTPADVLEREIRLFRRSNKKPSKLYDNDWSDLP